MKPLLLKNGLRPLRPWLFPLGVACAYGLGAWFMPEKTLRSVHVSGSILRNLVLPMGLVLAMMVVFNHYVSPAGLARFIGRKAGIKGILLSSLAGVLSMGPVYAWYPLLRTLRDNGASNFHLANFIGCRSVKPFLLPVLFAYFNWRLSLAFLAANLLGALVVAGIVGMACENRKPGHARPDR